jgi:hypothetical protein
MGVTINDFPRKTTTNLFIHIKHDLNKIFYEKTFGEVYYLGGIWRSVLPWDSVNLIHREILSKYSS